MSKAAHQYAAQSKNNQQKHVAPGMSTTPNSPGKIENKDKEIKSKVLKNMKF
jgi:hypothetical protein